MQFSSLLSLLSEASNRAGVSPEEDNKGDQLWVGRPRSIKARFHLCAQKYPSAVKRPLKIQHSHTFLVDIIKKLAVYALSVWQLGYV